MTVRILNETTELVPVKKLKRYPRNPRRGDREAIAESFRKHGFFGTVLVQRSTNRVIAGNHRLDAAVECKMKEIPVTWVDVTDEEARRILLVDNRLADNAKYDDAELARHLQELLEEGTALSDVGYTDDDLDALLDDCAVEIHQQDSARVDDLRPHPRNYKRHPEDQLLHLMESLKRHGFYRPVVLARGDVILVGHGIVMAAQRLNVRRVPVVRLDLEPDSPQALRLLTLDNELPGFGESDDRMLSEILREFAEQEGGLKGTGYDETMLAALVLNTRPASEIRDLDHAAEWVGMPDYEAGQKAIQLVINFDNFEDRERFMVQNAMKPLKKMANDHLFSTRWPHSEQEDAASVRFTVVE